MHEAPIRDWNIHLPAEYAIVSVAGARVAEYIAASEAIDGHRNLKILFHQEMLGRQLIHLRLEKSEIAIAGPWVLPNSQSVLHRVIRYGVEGGSVSVHVVPVAPEVQVESKQVLSFGDERIVLAVNFVAEVTRTGVSS